MSRMSEPFSTPARFRGPYRGGAPATVQERLAAQHGGGEALRRGDGWSACPFLSDQSARGRYLAIMWRRGWSAAQDELRWGAGG